MFHETRVQSQCVMRQRFFNAGGYCTVNAGGLLESTLASRSFMLLAQNWTCKPRVHAEICCDVPAVGCNLFCHRGGLAGLARLFAISLAS
jgi:hypothetical protein